MASQFANIQCNNIRAVSSMDCATGTATIDTTNTSSLTVTNDAVFDGEGGVTFNTTLEANNEANFNAGVRITGATSVDSLNVGQNATITDGLTVHGLTTINGNMVVNGKTTAIKSEEINLKDRYINMNFGNTSMNESMMSAGFVISSNATGSVCGNLTYTQGTGFAITSDVTDPTHGFISSGFIQMYNTDKHDGIYMINAATYSQGDKSTTISLSNVGIPDFCRQPPAETVNEVNIVPIRVTVFEMDDSGQFIVTKGVKKSELTASKRYMMMRDETYATLDNQSDDTVTSSITARVVHIKGIHTNNTGNAFSFANSYDGDERVVRNTSGVKVVVQGLSLDDENASRFTRIDGAWFRV